MRVGSLCTGYGGLDLAIGGDLAFVSEIDRDACTVIEQRFPGVPNLGDFTALDALPECDVLTAGFPCQPVSQAGRRVGTDDERWLWDDIERVVGGMERPPGVLFLENVRGLLAANGGHAMARVVSGLARLGYVGSYRLVAAADVGACHRRERVFIAACHAESQGSLTGESDSGAATHASHVGHERSGDARDGWTRSSDGDFVATHADRDSGSKRNLGPNQPEQPTPRRLDASRSGVFGPYWPAVARWERIIGRPAPDPTVADASSARRREVAGSVLSDATQLAGRAEEHDHQLDGAGEERNEPRSARLNPRFVEWMMGLPDGWVCDTGISRTAQLRILGNGVVPQQARAAWRLLAGPMEEAA